MSVFEPISFDTQKIGKVIKSSKQRYTWKILLDSLDYTVDMFYSKLSTKIKILVNGEIVLCTKATEQQIYKFQIRYRKLFVIKSGDLFDLRYEKLSAEAILSGRQKIRMSISQKEPPQKMQLRRSLPCSIPSEVPAINFRKTSKDVDLLEIRSSNPFDVMEDENLPALFKTSSLSSSNQVPWPSNEYFGPAKKRY